MKRFSLIPLIISITSCSWWKDRFQDSDKSHSKISVYNNTDNTVCVDWGDRKHDIKSFFLTYKANDYFATAYPHISLRIGLRRPNDFEDYFKRRDSLYIFVFDYNDLANYVEHKSYYIDKYYKFCLGQEDLIRNNWTIIFPNEDETIVTKELSYTIPKSK